MTVQRYAAQLLEAARADEAAATAECKDARFAAQYNPTGIPAYQAAAARQDRARQVLHLAEMMERILGG